MSESKTYVFGNEGSGQGGMMSLLAPLLQQRGLDPNLLLAMNKNGNGWGDGFMWVIFLFFLMGWGGNGWVVSAMVAQAVLLMKSTTTTVALSSWMPSVETETL